MAAYTRYASDYNNGSLAYNYGSTAPAYPQEWAAPAPGRTAAENTAPRVFEKTKAQPKALPYTQSISPLAIVGALCAAVMVIFLLMARIQLTEVTDQAVALEQQLTELEVAQNRLLIDYESAFNLTEIEEYATTTLGMQRPREDQIFYLDSTVPDKAVIIEKADDGEGLGDRFNDMLSLLSEYFK